MHRSFRRRRLPRWHWVPQIGFSEEPPLVVRRRRLDLPKHENRTLIIISVHGPLEVV